MNVSNISNAAAPATSWVRRVAGGGAAVWLVLGLVTAFLDPRTHGAGLIGLLGGFGAWLAAGVGLIVTALAAIAVYRRRGPAAGLIAGLACLALAVVALVVADWNALLEGAVTVVGVAVLVLLCFRSGSFSMPEHDEVDRDGWRNGWQGVGWYVGGVRIDDEVDEQDC